MSAAHSTRFSQSYYLENFEFRIVNEHHSFYKMLRTKRFLSEKQRGVLEDYYSRSIHASQDEREGIAKQLNVDKCRVRMWFESRRHREKRESSYQRRNKSDKRFTAEERVILEDIFNRSKYPSRRKRGVIAEQLDIDERSVQVWFQNRRYKEDRKPVRKPNHIRNEAEQHVPLSLEFLAPIAPTPTTVHLDHTVSSNEINNFQQFQNFPHQQQFQVTHTVYQPSYENQMFSFNQKIPAIPNQTPYSLTVDSVPVECRSTTTSSQQDIHNEHGNDWISPYDMIVPDVETFIQQHLQDDDLQPAQSIKIYGMTPSSIASRTAWQKTTLT